MKIMGLRPLKMFLALMWDTVMHTATVRVRTP